MSARIFLAGATVGAVVGAAVAVIALRSEQTSTPPAENAPTAAVHEEATSQTDSSAASTPPDVVPSAADRSVPVLAAPGRTAAVAPAPPDRISSAPGVAAAVDIASSPDPGDEMLRMHAELVARGESLEQLHERMKSEARDEAWASSVEREVGDFLARQPAPNALGSTSVECRKSVCRVLSIVDDHVLAAAPMTDLQEAISRLPDEALGREVVSKGVMVSGNPQRPGQTIEAAYLRRADKPTNANRR